MPDMEPRRPTGRKGVRVATSSQARHAFTLIDIAVICAILGIAAALTVSTFGRARANARSSSCQNNLMQLGLAFRIYREDYDGSFPPARIGGVRVVAPPVNAWDLKPPVGWEDALTPYLKNYSVNFCPGQGLKYGDPTTSSGTHFFFNGNLSALSSTKIKTPAATLLLGDGNDGHEQANGTYNKTALPARWLSDYNSPSYRHLGGANYTFADGHVKWLRPEKISTTPGAAYTFSNK